MLENHTDIFQSESSTPTPTPVIQEDRLARPFVLLGIGLLALVICNFALAWALINATGKKYTFVQLNDGTAVEVRGQDVFYRSEAVVQETTSQFLKLLWEWSEVLPGSDQRDPGFTFRLNDQEQIIPTSVYYASQLTWGGIGNQLVIEALNSEKRGNAKTVIMIEKIAAMEVLKKDSVRNCPVMNCFDTCEP